jgi:hypothetical protein
LLKADCSFPIGKTSISLVLMSYSINGVIKLIFNG